MPVRLLLVDDHAVVREGLHALLKDEPGLDIVGEAADGEEALALANELLPDVVLMDISMPNFDGIKATQQLTRDLPNIRVLILTVHEDESLLRMAIRAGIAGYLLKRAGRAEVVNAIHTVCRGETYIHPRIAHILFKNLAPPPAPKGAALEGLTPKEVDVLRFIVKGYTNRQIAEAMGLSIRTIEGHRLNLMNKLGLHTRLELVAFAEEHGLL